MGEWGNYMNEKYLIINGGSSSLKASLYEMPNGLELANVYVEKIGYDDSFYTIKYNGVKQKKEVYVKDHTTAVRLLLTELIEKGVVSDLNEIRGVGHRVLHGGEIYSTSVIVDEDVINNIEALTKLGPLHHPGEIAGILSVKKYLPNAVNVAVFDTAFHQTMPKENYLYAVPYEWYKENGVRKYGFHGTSHNYITDEMKKRYLKNDVNLIICHIGSGASIACVKEGKCYDTTMGLTPLDGLVMGTRSGSIDPSILGYICNERNLTIDEVTNILNKKSGLLGLSGKNDLRDVELLASEGNDLAKLAIDKMEKSVEDTIAKYYLELNGNVDALVFTAGVGENSSKFRKDVINYIKPLGVSVNESINDEIAGFKEIKSGKISTDDSAFDILVIPTDEEYMILKDTYKLSNLDKAKVYKKIK